MKSDAAMNRIDEEASTWAARIEGCAMNDCDRAAFAAWLEADAEHGQAFDRYTELSVRLDTQLPALAASLEATQRAIRRRRWTIASVAGLAATIAITAMLLTARPAELATGRAERRVATLDDGSRVELNAGSALVVDFRRQERRVRLWRGEALFSVTKDAVRPFVVEASAGVIRVEGTVFNVRAPRDDRVEVTVLEGTVRVRAPAEGTVENPVTPGNQAVVDEGQVSVRALPEGAAQDVVAWRQGQIVFDETSLAEVIDRLSAYHGREITIDPNAALLRLGGRYSLDDLNGLLESIESVLPVHVSHGKDGAVRITRDKSRVP